MSAPAKPVLDAKSANAGAGCLMLFGAPFALAGLAALWASYSEWSSGDPQENWRVPAVVGGMFTLVGGGIMAAGWFARGKMLETGNLESRHPEQPWMWRADWAQGRVESNAMGEMIFAWIFAGFWNALSWIVVIAGFDELWAEGGPALLVGMFPLVGLFLL